MQSYANLSGNSGVSGFEIGYDFITVWFKTGTRTYSNRKAGKVHIDNMKKLAIGSQGLNSYIKNAVNNLYD